MALEELRLGVKNPQVTNFTVYSRSENGIHRHQATGYQITSLGYLVIMLDDVVIAVYNTNDWISIRE